MFTVIRNRTSIYTHDERPPLCNMTNINEAASQTW